MKSNKKSLKVTICSSFTAEPIGPFANLIMDRLGVGVNLQFAPYSQVLQQLLAPNSALRDNTSALNVLLIRASDFVKNGLIDESSIVGAANEVAAAVNEYDANSSVPILLIVAAELDKATLELFEGVLLQGVRSAQTVNCIMNSQIDTWYPVPDPFDDDANALGHIPYRDTYFAALALTICRFAWRLGRAEKKVLVVDCDNTLWDGVVGEDGPAGITFSKKHLRLHRFLKRKADTGTLLCLSSKNVLEDVQAVFAQRKDLVLVESDFVSWKIDWRSKWENVLEIAAELNLSLDSFVFLDDNPVEIASMKAALPQVLGIQMPLAGDDHDAILEQYWGLDSYRLTQVDALRKGSYQSEIQRNNLKRSSGSFEKFLDGLQLEVDVREVEDTDVARVSQMTMRTNQFNATTRRMNESEVRQLSKNQQVKVYVCEVRDRFGDYGLVGCVVISHESEIPCVTDFLLSCRVLGRGVENRIMADVAKAVGQTRTTERALRVNFCATSKNIPVRNFLDSIAADKTVFRDGYFQFDIVDLENIPSQVTSIVASRTETAKPELLNGEISSDEDAMKIAWELRSPERVLVAASANTRRRSDLDTPFVMPKAGTEQVLAGIWCQILRMDSVGRTDKFVDLGGSSLDLVRVHSEILRVLGKNIPLPALLDRPTVADVAAVIDDDKERSDRVVNARNIAERQRAAIRRFRQDQPAGKL